MKIRYGRSLGLAVLLAVGACSPGPQTTGATDYDMIQDYFAAHSNTKVEQRAQRCNPSVRERINVMNRQLKTAAGPSTRRRP